MTLSFAFVEYESRRDADDAYHEMHNKRIGRDDLLKIEVTSCDEGSLHRLKANNSRLSGLALLLRPAGALMPAALGAQRGAQRGVRSDAQSALLAADPPHHLVAAGMMTIENATMSRVIAIVATAAIGIAPAAQRIVTAI